MNEEKIKIKNNEEIKPLDIFKNGIEDSNKYYHNEFPDISNEEIENAIKLLMNHREINGYLRRVKKYEDSRMARFHSNHCEICYKEYASFGITMINKDNEKELKWYCLEHEALGNLNAIKQKFKHIQEKDLDGLYKIVNEIVKSLTDKFERDYSRENK